MANLNSVAELSWLQLFPEGTSQSKVKKEQFIADAKTEYGYALWVKIMADKREEGELNVPSWLLSETELEVANDEMDISGLKVMRGLPFEIWLSNIGGIKCECRYIKTTMNMAQVLCDDDSLAAGDRLYYPSGKKIKFPKGVHKTPLPIIYANSGENIDGNIEVEDSLASVVRRSLIDLYGGKVDKKDVTNNSNPEQ